MEQCIPVHSQQKLGTTGMRDRYAVVSHNDKKSQPWQKNLAQIR